MKFSHIADVHIGGYRDDKLKDLSTKAFLEALKISEDEKVDFILISGDLFNSSFPTIDNLKIITSKFKELIDKKIMIYVIPGSHDFSPSGKTMLDVLENAGLCKNVVKGEIYEGKLRLKFTIDDKTGAKITGMLGKRGMLEKSFYEALDFSNLEQEDGFKIFMFHTAISELKRTDMQQMDSSPISLLPKGFNYYAGGHVHYPLAKFEEYLGGTIAYTGALFPNNFKELEDLKSGGFFIFDSEKNIAKFHHVALHPVYSIKIDCTHINPENIISKIIDNIKNKEFYDNIVLIRLFGKLSSGKPSDINLKQIFDELYNRGAYFVLKNTTGVESEEFEEIKLGNQASVDIEESIIKEHIGQMKFEKLSLNPDSEHTLIKTLISGLDLEKDEGEKIVDFEKRVIDNIKKIINF